MSAEPCRSPDVPAWKATIIFVAAVGGAVFIGALAPEYAASFVPEGLPGWASAVAAISGLIVAWYLTLWALWLPEKLAEPFLRVMDRIPVLRRHESLIISLVFALAISAPILARNYSHETFAAAPEAPMALVSASPASIGPLVSPVPAPRLTRPAWLLNLDKARARNAARQLARRRAR